MKVKFKKSKKNLTCCATVLLLMVMVASLPQALLLRSVGTPGNALLKEQVRAKGSG